MPKLDDGGPAFPLYTPEGRFNGNVSVAGMSLRDYFAARAPSEIPTWFRPAFPTVSDRTKHLRPMIIDEHVKNPRIRQLISDWRRDPIFDLHEGGENVEEKAYLRKYQEAYDEYNDACEAARMAREEERYFAWRWHYADAMLKARGS